jgi:hypothetical protein
VFHAGDRARAPRASVHDGRVHLVGSLRGEHRSLPGVEQRAVLEQTHHRLAGVEAAAALVQDLVTERERSLSFSRYCFFHVGRHLLGSEGAGAAMNGEREPSADSCAPAASIEAANVSAPSPAT